MKLKDGMVLGHVDGEDFAIATGKAMKHFNGVIHNNPTAAFLFELLQTEQDRRTAWWRRSRRNTM